MSVNIIVMLYFLCGLFTICVTKRKTAKEDTASYSSTNSSVQLKKCLKPTNGPYAKQPSAVLSMEVTDNIVKGNYTVIKEDTNVKLSVQDFYYENGKWQLKFHARNLTCRTNFIAALGKLFGIVHNKRNCTAPKGTYLFSVDVSKLERMWLDPQRYSRMIRRVEVYTKTGTIACYELESNVVLKEE